MNTASTCSFPFGVIGTNLEERINSLFDANRNENFIDGNRALKEIEKKKIVE